jgi:hypothetical protein
VHFSHFFEKRTFKQAKELAPAFLLTFTCNDDPERAAAKRAERNLEQRDKALAPFAETFSLSAQQTQRRRTNRKNLICAQFSPARPRRARPLHAVP